MPRASGAAVAPMGVGWNTYARLVGMAAAVVVLDQATKQVALGALASGPIDIIEGAVTLRLTFNSGGAFGILQGFPGFFLIVTLLVLVGILVWAGRLEDPRLVVPLGLVLGGGAGNLIDRVFRDFEGRVVDFVDLHVWPVFNVADSAITIGVIVIFAFAFFSPPTPSTPPTSSTDEAGTGPP